MNASSALAIKNGWGVGTELTGTDRIETTTIQITYLSDQMLVARNVRTGREQSWSLLHRDWQVA